MRRCASSFAGRHAERPLADRTVPRGLQPSTPPDGDRKCPGPLRVGVKAPLVSDHEGAFGRRWTSFPVPERLDWHPPSVRIARYEMPPEEATSRGNARIASSPVSGRPRAGWSGIGEPFGTCSESISIAEAFEGCPARARADESRRRAGLAVTARATRRKKASTTCRPSAGERSTSRIVEPLRWFGDLSKGGRHSRARHAGRVDARQEERALAIRRSETVFEARRRVPEVRRRLRTWSKTPRRWVPKTTSKGVRPVGSKLSTRRQTAS